MGNKRTTYQVQGKHYTDRETLSLAWQKWLKEFEPFDWYITLTFRDYTHPEIAYKRFFRMIRKMNEELFGKRYREQNKGLHYAVAIEQQKHEVIHLHCLIGGGASTLKKRKYSDFWMTESGFAQIKDYDPSLNAIKYITKDIYKGGEIRVHDPKRGR